MGRYDRQVLTAQLGARGQEILRRSSVTVVGCGGTGGHLATLMVRAGLGRVRIVESDMVELGNLHRQILYRDEDIGRPKAQVAAKRLARMNPEVEVEAVGERLGPENVWHVLGSCDLVLDGTDNFETRYLINEYMVASGTSGIFCGALAGWASVVPVVPGRTACLRCIYPEQPGPGTVPDSKTVGVLNSAPAAAAALGATLALRLLVQGWSGPARHMMLDLWGLEVTVADVPRREDCPCCVQGRFELLDPKTAIQTDAGRS